MVHSILHRLSPSNLVPCPAAGTEDAGRLLLGGVVVLWHLVVEHLLGLGML